MIRFTGKNASFSVVYHAPVKGPDGTYAHVSLRLKVPTPEGDKNLTIQGQLYPLPEDSPVLKDAVGISNGLDARQIESLVDENWALRARVQELEEQCDNYAGFYSNEDGRVS